MKTESETFHMTMTIQRRDSIRPESGIPREAPGAVPGVFWKRDGQRRSFESHRTGETRIRRFRERLNRFNRVGRCGRFRTDKMGDRCQTDTSVDRCKTDKFETAPLCGILCKSVEVAGGAA